MNLLQVALDVLQTIVRSSTLPLSAELVQSGFPAAARCVLQSDDNSTMQVCMLSIFSCFCFPLLSFMKMNFLKNLFQEHYQSVKGFGSRSGPTSKGLDPDEDRHQRVWIHSFIFIQIQTEHFVGPDLGLNFFPR